MKTKSSKETGYKEKKKKTIGSTRKKKPLVVERKKNHDQYFELRNKTSPSIYSH